MLRPEEKIAILLKEYDALRAEILARTSGAFTLVTVGAAIFTVILSWISLHAHPLSLGILIAVCMCALGFIIWQNGLWTIQLSKRVQEIEANVNALAGAPLLRWENEFGGLSRGMLKPRPVVRIFPAPTLVGCDPELARIFTQTFDSVNVARKAPYSGR